MHLKKAATLGATCMFLGLFLAVPSPARAECNDLVIFSGTAVFFTNPTTGARGFVRPFAPNSNFAQCFARTEADTPTPLPALLNPGANSIDIRFVGEVAGNPQKIEGFLDASALGGPVGAIELTSDTLVPGEPASFWDSDTFEIDPARIGCVSARVAGQSNVYCTGYKAAVTPFPCQYPPVLPVPPVPLTLPVSPPQPPYPPLPNPPPFPVQPPVSLPVPLGYPGPLPCPDLPARPAPPAAPATPPVPPLPY